MSSPTPAKAAPRKRPVRKRYVVLLVIAGLLLTVFLFGYVRGTWADREPRDSKSSSEGVVCRLYQPAEGPWQVRCSMVLDHPPEKVWAVITEYDNFADIFPTLASCAAEEKDAGNVRLTGIAHSTLGDWPYDIVVQHVVKPDEYHSHWEGDSGEVQKLVGSWTVTSAGDGKTLLVYASHVEIKRYPDWVVVNAMLLRQPKVMNAVRAWLDREQP